MVGLSSQHGLYVIAAVVVVTVVVSIAELLHSHRVRRIGHLAFGPKARPTFWVQAVAYLRPIAAGLLAGAMMTLALLQPMAHRKDDGEVAFEKLKHVIVLLDVSPSMRLVDAGDKGDQSRMKRAREVMESYFQRIPMNEFRVTVIAVYLSLIHI